LLDAALVEVEFRRNFFDAPLLKVLEDETDALDFA